MRRVGIIGGGRFGSSLAEALAALGIEVLLLDRDRDVVDRLAGTVSKAMQGDATDEGTLNATGFKECDVVVVAVGSDMESSVLATLMLKEMKIAHIVAKATTDMHGKVLSRVGADRVVYPDRDMAARLARSLAAPTVLDYAEVSEGVSVLEIQAPLEYVGKTLAESKIRKNFGATVLVLRRAAQPDGTQDTIVSPDADDTIELGDIMVIFGADDKLQKLEKEISG